MKVDGFDTVLISGLGPVGLGAVINAVYLGARVIVVAKNQYRRELAAKLGADLVIDAGDQDVSERIMSATAGTGVDKAVDCSGGSIYQRLLIDTVRRKGQVSFVGESGELSVNVSHDIIHKGLSFHGIWHWNLTDTPDMMKMIQHSRTQLDTLITHTFPMSQIAEAFELQLTGQCGKVILDPSC